MRLYVDAQYASPYAMSAFVALTEKRIPIELTKVNLAEGAQHDAWYAAASFSHRVPTLVDGEFSLSESSAIAEYLDEMYPGTRLYPREPRARARARQLQAWLRSDLTPIREERNTQVVFYRPVPQPLSNAARETALKLFAAVETLLAPDAQHLFGEWSIADTDLALMLNRLVMNGDTVPGRLAHYARFQWARASVQQWVHLPRPKLTPGAPS